MDTTAKGRRRNRSWPEALKREIVATSFAPGSSVSVVARRYDVNTNQVFGWRKLYRDGCLRRPMRPARAGAGDGHGGTGCDVVAGIACGGHDRDRAGERVSRSCRQRRRRARRCGGCSTCWSGDDPGSVGRAGLAGGRPDRHAQGDEHPGASGPGGCWGAIPMPAISTFSGAPEVT